MRRGNSAEAGPFLSGAVAFAGASGLLWAFLEILLGALEPLVVLEIYFEELRKGSVCEEERVRRLDRSFTGTMDAREGQRGRGLTPTLQRTLKELREKEGKRRRAIGVNVR